MRWAAGDGGEVYSREVFERSDVDEVYPREIFERSDVDEVYPREVFEPFDSAQGPRRSSAVPSGAEGKQAGLRSGNSTKASGYQCQETQQQQAAL
jgi:hypothetical protein